MEAHEEMQKETMTTYGEVIDLLDEVVDVSIDRTVRHHEFTESQILQRRSQEESGGFYRLVASFLAQRACHTAQANALLLRHGFQDQAFELWRTMVNLREQLENMIGEEQEREAEKFLNATVAEMKSLDEKAKGSGSILGRLFDESGEDRIRELADAISDMYGPGILKRDGWKNPNPAETEYRVNEQLQAEMDHEYRLASKLQHGTPISMLIGGDFEFRPLRNPLEHKTEGVPVQCMMTGFMLHSIVTMFCETTAEKKDSLDDVLMTRAGQALHTISEFHSP